MAVGPKAYVCPACGGNKMRPDKSRGRYLVICDRCESIVDRWTQYGGRSGKAEVIRQGYERLLAARYGPEDTLWKVFTAIVGAPTPLSVRGVGRVVGITKSPAHRHMRALRDDLGLIKRDRRGWVLA